MRNNNNGKAGIIGLAALAVLVLVLLIVPGLGAEEPPYTLIQSEPTKCTFVEFGEFPSHKSHAIETQNSEILLYICKVKDISPPPAETTQYDGETYNGGGTRCEVKAFGVVFNTTDWYQVVTTSGEGTLTCRFNPSS